MAKTSATTKARPKKIRSACRVCGKARQFLNLSSTFCCGNTVCEDYVDDGKSVCHYNHRNYSCCALHHRHGHEGKWRDCEECIEEGDPEYDFIEVTCVSCGFKSQTLDDFAFQLNDDFYCKKDECQAKVKPPPSRRAKRNVERAKKVSKVVVKEVKKACRSCGKISKLTKTQCCNNWICDDADKYVMFSYALNSCYRNHHRYSSCSYHHRESHEGGKWRDCQKCKEITCGVDSDFDDVKCVGCGFTSERIEKFSFQINKDFYCKKDECHQKCKQILDAIGWTPKRKIGGEEVSGAETKKAKVVCGICDKGRKLTKTKCCDKWICDNLTSDFYVDKCLGYHEKYSWCAFHHSQGHEGKALDCDICKKRGCFKFDFEDFETDSLNFEQENVDAAENIPESIDKYQINVRLPSYFRSEDA